MSGIVFSDSYFTGQLARGRSSEMAVALRLMDAGFWVKSPGAPFFGRTPGTTVDYDIVVAHNRQRFRIEVKGRDVHHGDEPMSYPYAIAFLDSCHSYDRKQEKPFAYVLRSELTGQMLVALASDKNAWTTKECPDKRAPGKTQRSYVVPRSSLRPFGDLVDALESQGEVKAA